MSLKDKIDINKLPVHVAIIMDGNGRWAKQRRRDRIFGHIKGVDAVREIIECSAELGINYVSLYAFSTENWKRPWEEVEALMELMIQSLNKEAKRLIDNNIRLRVIGDIERLSPKVRKSLDDTLNRTALCDRMTLVVALSYSSRWEIIEAVRNITSDVSEGLIDKEEISDKLFENYLTTRGIPDPELLIRTSGELRVSNFLLWQIAYSELYITDTLWPDFGKEELYKALVDYQKRERRFGKTSEQLHENEE